MRLTHEINLIFRSHSFYCRFLPQWLDSSSLQLSSYFSYPVIVTQSSLQSSTSSLSFSQAMARPRPAGRSGWPAPGTRSPVAWSPKWKYVNMCWDICFIYICVIYIYMLFIFMIYIDLYPFSPFSPCFHGSCWNISWTTCVSSSVAIASATSASCDSHCSLEWPLWSKVYFQWPKWGSIIGQSIWNPWSGRLGSVVTLFSLSTDTQPGPRPLARPPAWPRQTDGSILWLVTSCKIL